MSDAKELESGTKDSLSNAEDYESDAKVVEAAIASDELEVMEQGAEEAQDPPEVFTSPEVFKSPVNYVTKWWSHFRNDDKKGPKKKPLSKNLWSHFWAHRKVGTQSW